MTQDVKIDPKTGLWYRPDTDDLGGIRESQRVYKNMAVRPGDVVLDLGGHIGSSVWMALEKGAAKVVVLEPSADNLVLLDMNMGRRPDVTIIPAAVDAVTGTATLYVASSKGRWGHSLVTKGKKHPVEVNTVALSELLETHRPDVLKCDIEYGEFRILETLCDLPRYVRALSMEVHLQRNRQAGMDLITGIEAQGFTPIAPRTITPQAWAIDMSWERAA